LHSWLGITHLVTSAYRNKCRSSYKVPDLLASDFNQNFNVLTNFHERFSNLFNSRVDACEQTDMVKLTGTLAQFSVVNTTKNTTST
jgi:hypothetical protein